MTDYVTGVDLGGTKVEACLLDPDRNIIARERMMSEAHLGLDHVIGNILRLIERVAGDKSSAAVGLGTPGTYLASEDTLYGSPHTRVYETPGFIERLKREINAPLIVENDANCLALAEYFAGCEGKYQHVLAVILGTGFGSGLILNGKLYRGARGGAGEIGHTTVDFRGRECNCGRKGCAEAYLSGPALSDRFFERSGKRVETRTIHELYRNGDPEAIGLFDKSCRIMGEVFANAVNAFDLEAIILGGGVSNIPVWYEGVPAYLKKSLFGYPRPEIPLLKAQLGDSAGVVGAAYLALRHIGKMTF